MQTFCQYLRRVDVYLAETYKPVSLTSVSCKLLEHVICKHMLNHLEKKITF